MTVSRRFYRVVSDADWQQIKRTSNLSPSVTGWPPYSPGDAVFLYPEDVPRHFLEARARELCEEGRGPAHLIEVELPDSLLAHLEPDASFCGYDDASAYRGTIDAAMGCRIEHIETLEG